MIEAAAHEACSRVSRSCVGDIEILGGLLEQFVLVERTSGIETVKVWTVNPHSNWIALDALHHDFRYTHTLVGVCW